MIIKHVVNILLMQALYEVTVPMGFKHKPADKMTGNIIAAIDMLLIRLLFSFRWTAELEELKQRRVKLLGDCLMGAGFLSYVGAFSSEFRSQMTNVDWVESVQTKNIPMSDPFKLEALLTNDVEISQ